VSGVGRRIRDKGHGTRERAKGSTAKKDLDFRRMCRLINAFGNVRKGILQKKMLENDVRSGNVYENKGNTDKMPMKKSDIFVYLSDIFG
jgi:hypothetical protein